MVVEVYDGAYVKQTQAPDYQTCSVTWRYLAVGSGTLIVSEDDPAAGVLLDCVTKVVPVRITLNGMKWSGRVITAQYDEDADSPPTVTATLVDDWAWLRAMLASQNGANPDLTNMSSYDTQTAEAAQLARYYISAAAQRLGVSVQVTNRGLFGTTSSTLNARMDALDELLTVPLSASNLSMRAYTWLPGDVQPPGLTLTAPTVVFDPKQMTDKSWLQWSTSVGSLSDVHLTASAPSAYRTVLGLDGQDVDRRYYGYTNTDLQGTLGAFGFPELYVDATDLSDMDDPLPRAQQKLAEKAGTVSASFTVQDGVPWTYGTDYRVGDVGSFDVAGVQFRERITQVTATDNRDGGLVFTPQIGDPNASDSSDNAVIAAVQRIASDIRSIQKGR